MTNQGACLIEERGIPHFSPQGKDDPLEPIAAGDASNPPEAIDSSNVFVSTTGTADEEVFFPHVTVDDESAQKEPESPQDTTPTVSLLDLFKYATRKEKLLLCVGVLGATIAGVLVSCYAVLFGELLDAFSDPTTNFMDKVTEISLIFTYFGIGMFTGCKL